VVVGGLLVGLIEIFIAVFASPELAEISVFGVLILILLIKPDGIMSIRRV
jgi:branched-chain amino acid transport system permease protein